jgi:alkanesulfonate monooxygenase
VLRGHCEREGRDYDTIEKTTTLGIGADSTPGELIEQLRGMHELGFSVAYVSIRGTEPLGALEMLGERVLPEITTW